MATNKPSRQYPRFWDLGDLLDAAGVAMEERDRVTEVHIIGRPTEPVMIRVTYLADDRLFTLAEKEGTGTNGPEGHDHSSHSGSGGVAGDPGNSAPYGH